MYWWRRRKNNIFCSLFWHQKGAGDEFGWSPPLLFCFLQNKEFMVIVVCICPVILLQLLFLYLLFSFCYCLFSFFPCWNGLSVGVFVFVWRGSRILCSCVPHELQGGGREKMYDPWPWRMNEWPTGYNQTLHHFFTFEEEKEKGDGEKGLRNCANHLMQSNVTNNNSAENYRNRKYIILPLVDIW